MTQLFCHRAHSAVQTMGLRITYSSTQQSHVSFGNPDHWSPACRRVPPTGAAHVSCFANSCCHSVMNCKNHSRHFCCCCESPIDPSVQQTPFQAELFEWKPSCCSFPFPASGAAIPSIYFGMLKSANIPAPHHQSIPVWFCATDSVSRVQFPFPIERRLPVLRYSQLIWHWPHVSVDTHEVSQYRMWLNASRPALRIGSDKSNH